MSEQCMQCHTEIGWQRERGLGLHGREEMADCSKCHPDHAGVDFKLIDWGPGGRVGFDHARTGWPRTGRHAAAQCHDCHKRAYQVGEVVARIKRRDPDDSWLGLVGNCSGCHEDSHEKELGENCTRCHNDLAWKPAPSFDHVESSFRLTGKHVDVACAKCHMVPGKIFVTSADGKTLPRYKPVPHAECTSCHKDTHAGQLGPECTSCHVTESFLKVDKNRFDHDRTKYPLRGKHRTVVCALCHDATTAWGKQPPFSTCDSCHKDAHAGTATLAGKQVDCASCHDVSGFRPSAFTATDHERTDYPLEGKHRDVVCGKCHLKNPASIAGSILGSSAVLMRPESDHCRDCHEEAHGKQLAEREDTGECDACHTLERWRPSTFTLAHHEKTRFPLAGGHAEAQCSACHGPTRPDLEPLPVASQTGPALVALTLVSAECGSCHFDPHHGRFGENGERPFDGGCKACHGFDDFRPSTVQPSAHRKFSYPLEEAHEATPCFECHEALTQPPARIHLLRVEGPSRSLTFVAKHERCETCHENPHGDQFTDHGEGRACETCHDVAAFVPAGRFDHDRDSAFALGKAHHEVVCADCHAKTRGADGVERVIYRPVPTKCEACHGPGKEFTPRAPRTSAEGPGAGTR